MNFLETVMKAKEERASFIQQKETQKAAAEQALAQALASVEEAKQTYAAIPSDTNYKKIKDAEKEAEAQKTIIAECSERMSFLRAVKVVYEEQTIMQELKAIEEEKGLVSKIDTILEKQAELEALKEEYKTDHKDFMKTVVRTTHGINYISGLKYQDKNKLRDKINNYVGDTFSAKSRAAGIDVDTFTFMAHYDRD